MAIISTLIGGVCGFITFLTALIFFNVGFLSALGLYALVGLGLTGLLITAALTWRALISVASSSTSRARYPSAGHPTLAKRSG